MTKLEGRVTGQGLVGIAFQGKKAAIVQVNCETDFVAKNKYFKEMVDVASSSCLLYAKNLESTETIHKVINYLFNYFKCVYILENDKYICLSFYIYYLYCS